MQTFLNKGIFKKNISKHLWKSLEFIRQKFAKNWDHAAGECPKINIEVAVTKN